MPVMPIKEARAGLYQVCENSILTRYRKGPGLGAVGFDVDEFGNLITVDTPDVLPPDVNVKPNNTGTGPCDPNTSYPTGHRCAKVQQGIDASNVLATIFPVGTPRIVGQNVQPTPSGAVPNTGAAIATWISQNSMLVTIGVAGLLLLKIAGGRR